MLHSPDDLFMLNFVCTAKAGHEEYELFTTMDGRSFVRNKRTKVQWSLSWQDLVGLAQAEGIDKTWPGKTRV